MALVYVGGNTGTWAGATSGNNNVSLTALTGGIASAAQANDFVVAVYATGSAAARTLVIQDPSAVAYTLIDVQRYANGTTYDSNLRVAYKRLTAADANVVFGPTGNAQDAGAAAIHVWRGVDATTPQDVTAVGTSGTGTGRPNPIAITPVTAGAVVIATGGAAAGTGAVFVGTGLSNFRTATSVDTNDGMVGIGSFAWTSGPYDPAAWTGGTANAADSWTSITLALRPAPALPAITGTMAATETGADNFAATGDVLVQGSFAATEVGEDTFAATGTVSDAAVTGSMAATETGSDTFVSTGAVLVQGTLAATETGSDTFASTGTVLVEGSFAATETGQDVFLASGGPLVVGNMAATETGSDTFASTGTVLVQGTLAATETGSDTFAATGKVLVAGALAATEVGEDVFAATGTVVLGPVTGVMSATETGTDTFAATGTVLIRGSFAATEVGQDSFAATGTITVQGSLAAVEVGQDVFQATGFTGAAIVGSMSATDQPDGFGELYVDASYVEAGYVVSGVFGVVSGAAWVIVPLPAEPAWSPPASVVAPVWTSSALVPEPSWAQPPSPPEPPWSGGAASTPPAWQSL